MTAQDTLSILDDLIVAARKAGADAADALVAEGRSLSVSWRLGKMESLQSSEGGDIGLRVFVGRQSAVVSSADRSRQALEELVERAVAMARQVPEDPYSGLADPDQLAHDIPFIDGCDPTDRSTEDLIEDARTAEEAALAVSGVTNSEGADAGWHRTRVAFAASNGFSHAYEVSGSSVSVAVLAGDSNSGMERDYDYSSAVYVNDLRPAADVGACAGERAVRRVGARRVKTCRVPVVLDRRVARGIIGHLTGAISGPSVARKTTFLKDSLGQQIFSPSIRIVEDPHLLRGQRSRPVDAEGLPTSRRLLVEDGVLTTWLLDLRSARQLGMAPTGHASRGTSSQPGPSPANVWMEAGDLTVDELIADIPQGLFVTDLFGQGVNGLTGDYSRGAAGFWIENGKICWPVNEVTVAGTLQEIFRTLTPASDLERQYGFDAPTLRLGEMMVAGG